MSAPYEDMIEILSKCASEKGVSKKLVKQIYDLERGQIHLTHRDLEGDLRKKILEFMPKEEKEKKKDEES